MRNRGLAAAALAAVVGLAVPGAAAGGVRPRLTATVRVYDAYGVARVESQAARTSLQDVFASAGISLTWIDCHGGPPDPGPCAAPLHLNELVVRFVHASSARQGDSFAMGDALVSGGGTGTVLTVYPDEVQRVVGAAHDAGQLLGRVMAHEIGHLLLGPHAHSRDGLMRPVWSRDEIARDNRLDWRFSGHERAKIRARLSERLELAATAYAAASTAAMAGWP
jgi:hypothetical protein